MNLQTRLKPELWAAISSTYQSGNYTHAILDAMHHLSDVLRAKTGVDSDGQKLVTEVLGGDPPKLRLNRYQTETEKSIQRGYMQLLMGLYLAIRNPRSHEHPEHLADTQPTADAIIYFISYMESILEQSEEVFTIEGFLSRVFDPDFVDSQRYVELIVDEIPVKKRLETLIELFRNKLR